VTQPTAPRPYHHGDLRRALLSAAVAAIEDAGPAAMSLRDVARRAGVSHAASSHHFGDKAGLLTALAAEGFGLLAGTLQRAQQETGSFLEVGVAYVHFAVTHRAHFDVMFRPELTRADDPELRSAKAAAARILYGQRPGEGQPTGQQLSGGVAAWSLVHGIATLWLNANLPPGLGDDPEQLTRLVASPLRVDGDRPGG
jgi:AcrR family transcriptional regulator